MSYTQTQTNTKKQKIMWMVGGIVVVLIALFFLRQNQAAGSEIEISPTGNEATVYIDRTQVNPPTSTSSPTTYDVADGERQLLLAADGYWPWSQNVSVPESETVEVSPFLIEETGRRVLQTTSEVKQGLSTAQEQPVPSSDDPVLSDNEDVRVFVDDDTNIIAQWNKDESTAPDFFDCYEGTCGVSVFNQAPVRQIAFYPGRDDVIFFSTPTGVYAIEINPRGETQNFQPVAEGVRDPVFTISDGNIFVLSGERITVSDI